MDVFEKYVGQVFDNRYKIEKIIGIGGMAVVYKAVDMLMRRTVAVKMLKDDIANDIQSVKRFINESKAVAMLSHPNIVNIYDVSVKDNVKYIVMEYVEGITLKNYMTRKGVLSFREIMSYTEQILHALDHAHQKGIVHRDIKPQNIMLLKNGIIKVMDFGIAKLPNAETVTMTDKAIGTVYYISPEQVSGKPIDARSDLYALGVLMYEMATGKLPFTADSPVSVALMQVNETAVPPKDVNPEISTGLEQIIIKAMEKDPDMRFQNTAMMLRQVVKLKENPKIVFKQVVAHLKGVDKKNKSASKNETAADNTDNGKPVKRASRSMFPVILGVALAVIAVVGIAAFYLINELFFSDNQNTTYALPTPTFVGETYTDTMMKNLIEDGCYDVELIEIFSSEYPEGYIIEQDPLPGEERKVRPNILLCPLKLTVSKGERNGTIPDITMYNYRDAKILLTNNGFIVNDPIGETHPTYLENSVIRTEPPIGTTINADDAITIYYSIGPSFEKTTVPKFEGMSEPEALQLVVINNLEVGRVTYEESQKTSGTILKQSVDADEVVDAYTEIDFVISSGIPETTAPPETEPPVENDTHTITIPTFVGKTYTEKLMKELLEEEYYDVEITEQFSSQYPKGYIIDQDPPPGEEREVDPNVPPFPLKLTVSKGEKTETVPNIIGDNYKEAVIFLTNEGFTVTDTIGESHPTHPENSVIRTDPAIGSAVNADKTITIYYSTGFTAKKTISPELIGLSETEALNTIIAYNLAIGTVTYEESSKAEGTVIWQSIDALESVDEYTEIDIVISSGMAEGEE